MREVGGIEGFVISGVVGCVAVRGRCGCGGVSSGRGSGSDEAVCGISGRPLIRSFIVSSRRIGKNIGVEM